MGLFYRLSSVIFMGKSLAGHGGQNPIEPAKLGSAILHGPHIGNFIDVYGALDSEGGAIPVKDADDLARQLQALLGGSGLSAPHSRGLAPRRRRAGRRVR